MTVTEPDRIDRPDHNSAVLRFLLSVAEAAALLVPVAVVLLVAAATFSFQP
jgi:hypothetical protein